MSAPDALQSVGETPEVITFRHDLDEGDYALLTVVSTSKRVFSTFSSTLHFPPSPETFTFQALDVPGAIHMAEAALARECPGHVCTSLCDRFWKQLAPSEGRPITDKKQVN